MSSRRLGGSSSRSALLLPGKTALHLLPGMLRLCRGLPCGSPPPRRHRWILGGCSPRGDRACRRGARSRPPESLDVPRRRGSGIRFRRRTARTGPPAVSGGRPCGRFPGSSSHKAVPVGADSCGRRPDGSRRCLRPRRWSGGSPVRSSSPGCGSGACRGALPDRGPATALLRVAQGGLSRQ